MQIKIGIVIKIYEYSKYEVNVNIVKVNKNFGLIITIPKIFLSLGGLYSTRNN